MTNRYETHTVEKPLISHHAARLRECVRRYLFDSFGNYATLLLHTKLWIYTQSVQAKDRSGMKPREDFTVSLAAFDGHPLETGVETVAALGVKLVEPALIQGYTDPFDEDVFSEARARKIRRQFEMAGLSCSAFSAHIDVGAPDGGEQLLSRLRFAAELGAQRVVTNAAKAEFRKTFIERIDELVREAESVGVLIALENPGDGQPNVIDNAASASALMREYPTPWLGLNYDPGNLLTHQPHLDSVTDAMHLGPGLVSMHLKNALFNGERWRFTALNRGTIDYESILAHADTLSPAPDYSIELPLRVSRAPGGKPYRDRDPVPISTIRTALEESLQWLEEHRLR